MLLVGTQIAQRINRNPQLVAGSAPDAICGTSVKVRLASQLRVEEKDSSLAKDEFGVLSLRDADNITYREVDMSSGDAGHLLYPGEFVLAETEEIFNVPADLTGIFMLRSTAARQGLNQGQAALLRPGWCGRLTLELQNVSLYHAVQIRPGDEIGHVLFFSHEAVQPQKLYRGRFHEPASSV